MLIIAYTFKIGILTWSDYLVAPAYIHGCHVWRLDTGRTLNQNTPPCEHVVRRWRPMEINPTSMGVISEAFITADENEILRPLLTVLLGVHFHPVVRKLKVKRTYVGHASPCDESD